tara:strand:- start:1129 stop:2553 length:1425 start_codon:yes stop_codon:yes gene_type:complete
MKVVIANPPWPGEGYGTRSNVRWPHRRGDKVLTFPIYLAYTVSVLREEGFDVKGIDAVDKEWGIFRFVNEMKKLAPSVIIMEVSTPSSMYDLQTAEELKKELKDVFIVFCGPHASYFHKEIIENYKFVDGCIKGEIEYTARDLCNALKNKTSLKDVNGLTFKEGVNKDRELIKNLDELPFPDRDDFKIEDYMQAFFSGKKTAMMISSRGCPYQCSFCLWPNVFTGHVPRFISPEKVVDEIEYLVKEKGVDEIFFDDETLTVTKERIQGVCDEMIKREVKVPWLCNGRVDNVDSDVLKLMKKAGCTRIFYGVESGSEKILKSMCKGISKEKALKAVRETQKTGIVACVSFTIGMPDENKDTINETLKFAKKLHADYTQFTLTAPFPGTKLFEEAKEKGLLEIDSWEDLDGTKGPILRTEHLSREELKGVISRLYLAYYTSPVVIWQNLKMIRGGRDIRRIFRGLRSVISRIIFYR